MALVSTIKTVVQVVNNLDESRKIYENGLGLICLGEGETSVNEIGELWGIKRGNFRIARFAREGEDFGCVDLVENIDANSPMRDQNRAFDFGIMTINYRTNNIEKAVPMLEKVGCKPVSEILNYNVGKPMRELMMNTPTGERLTIIEVGGVNDDLPVFTEAVATVGLVVPKMADAKLFYEQGLGLNTAIAFEAAGSPFDSLLGVNKLDKLDFATLTSEGNWTGKVELLELETDETPNYANEFADFLHTGYSFVTFLSEDLDEVSENCKAVGAKIIVEPKEFKRPFHEGRRAMIVRSLGGEYLEIIENKYE
jgi:hypothetical protein